MKAAIEVSNLGKVFRIGASVEKYLTLRDKIAEAMSFDGSARKRRQEETTFWALQDVSFRVEPGEVVGVIGRNGAGKSTLLKILSRITEPTTGRAIIRGRVGCLLEVGTGFHNELSGRDNIYLNGAILGMRRKEINRKFNDIVEFAEVNQFIYTPVKHYSSGMYLRLAFAVAAFLDPEILIVDEVLTVGDMKFQQKCLGKMTEVAAEGRTVLFVSHNLGAVKELCQSSLLLDRGRVQFRGEVAEGLRYYSGAARISEEEEQRAGFSRVLVSGYTGQTGVIESGEPFTVSTKLTTDQPCASGYLFCIVKDCLGNLLVHEKYPIERLMNAGTHNVSLSIPSLWLAPGAYTFMMKLVGTGPTGVQVRYVSDSTFVEVPGSVATLSKALLAPGCSWQVAFNAQDTCLETISTPNCV